MGINSGLFRLTCGLKVRIDLTMQENWNQVWLYRIWLVGLISAQLQIGRNSKMPDSLVIKIKVQLPYTWINQHTHNDLAIAPKQHLNTILPYP